MKILLVEDETESIELICSGLRKSSWLCSYDYPELFTCMNLQTAIAHAHSVTPDVILLDLKLPDSPLHSTVDRIVEFSRIAPVIVMTNARNPDLAIKCLTQGARDFIDKMDLKDKQEILEHAIQIAVGENKRRKQDATKKTLDHLDQIKEQLEKLG